MCDEMLGPLSSLSLLRSWDEHRCYSVLLLKCASQTEIFESFLKFD
jgi:hypothetical protein